MAFLKRLAFVFIALLFKGAAFSQSPSLPQEKVLQKQQLVEDYDILYASLINYHPNPYLYISEGDLRSHYERQRSSLPDSLTELGFHYMTQQLIMQIRCGHSTSMPSKAWYASMKGQNVQFPCDVRLKDRRLFITNTIEGEFEFSENDELLSINNTSVKTLLQQMADMQPRDGLTESFSNALIERRFRTYLLFLRGIEAAYEITYQTSDGEVKTATLEPTNKRFKEIPEPKLPLDLSQVLKNSWSTLSFDTVTNLAYLKIDNFSDRKVFRKYYQSVFQYLEQRPGAKLIVDLRDNPGGYFMNGNHFLSYLTPHKFELNFQRPKKKDEKNKYVKLNFWNKLTYMGFSAKPSKHRLKGQKTTTFGFKPSKHLFTGKVYLLANGLTFSQASLVAANMKANGAVVLGEETGGAEIGCNGMLMYDLELPNSGIAVTIPAYQVKSNSTKGKFGYGVIPDYPIARILDNARDRTLETAIETILKAQ